VTIRSQDIGQKLRKVQSEERRQEKTGEERRQRSLQNKLM